MLYLTPIEWNAKEDGGELYIFGRQPDGDPGDNDAMNRDDAQPRSVVQPAGGTLVVFDSATVPHRVLPCRRVRRAIAGWLHAGTLQTDETVVKGN